MKLDDLEVYILSMDFSDKIWRMLADWDKFVKDTLGKQLIRSADSVAANISEGFGRNSFRDQRNFYYIARGSLYETKTWISKAQRRNLITDVQYNELIDEMNHLAIKLNNFITSVTKLMNQNTPTK